MSEVKRYWVPCGSMDCDGWHQDDNEVVLAGEHDKAMKAAQSELAALREELAERNQGIVNVCIERDTAEQRNAVRDIESAAKVLANCMDYPWEHMPENGRVLMRKYAQAVIDAALKPTESGASE